VATDDFDRVRGERDPLRQAQRATELLALYQQRGVELARLRREAINRAADELNLSYTAVAARIGLSKGRITQIRQSAPPAERAFFGVGPLTVAVPLRQMPERPTGVIAREDSAAADRLISLLTLLQFQVEQFHIPTDGEWTPPRETLAICGPKSSRVTAEAIDSDPHLTYGPDTRRRWAIRDKATGKQLRSPMDAGATEEDIAYIGRLAYKRQTLFVIAGVHALGSLGAVDYLVDNVAELYETVGTQRFSMVVRSAFEGDRVTATEVLWGPQTHV
jgi:hypothetical protein